MRSSVNVVVASADNVEIVLLQLSSAPIDAANTNYATITPRKSNCNRRMQLKNEKKMSTSYKNKDAVKHIIAGGSTNTGKLYCVRNVVKKNEPEDRGPQQVPAQDLADKERDLNPMDDTAYFRYNKYNYYFGSSSSYNYYKNKLRNSDNKIDIGMSTAAAAAGRSYPNYRYVASSSNVVTLPAKVEKKSNGYDDSIVFATPLVERRGVHFLDSVNDCDVDDDIEDAVSLLLENTCPKKKFVKKRCYKKTTDKAIYEKNVPYLLYRHRRHSSSLLSKLHCNNIKSNFVY